MNIHRSFNLTYHGVQTQQHWNPFLEIAGDESKEKFVEQMDLIREERENPKDPKDRKAPFLTMLGVGAWYSKPSNGYEDPVESLNRAMHNVSEILGPRPGDFLTDAMDPIDGIGDQVFFAPPSGPYYNGDNEERQKERTLMRSYVRAMQDDLAKKSEDDFNFNLAWAIPGVVTDQNKTFVDPTDTGFHVIDRVAELKANILLNLRCNAVLDSMKGYPYTRTCCTDYGSKPFTQLCLVAFGFFYLAACVVFEVLDVVAKRSKPRFPWLSMDTGAFVMAVLICYYADRTQLFAKGEKHWSWTDFWALCAPCLLLTLVSIRKSKNPPARNGALTVEADQPFLSRDQTEEWKGWMQAVILIYHWTGAGRPSIYIFVRLLVASYLFQTGYGHTTFFLKKKDFGFKRFASVLLRLNLLPCTLAYVMNTDYMFYYFSPLCSFWFVIVYLTLAIGNKHNDDTQLVLSKICISAVLVSFVVLATPLNRWAFVLLRYLCNIQWSLKEWEYRVALDCFVVYTGMLTAVAYLKCKEEIRGTLRFSMALLGLAVMGGYSYASRDVSTGEYKAWHPYISFVPILAFIAVRNISGTVRNYYSTGIAWLGKCSLETYTLQFHMFLAADTYGVLLLDWFNGGDQTLLGDRWRSLLFIVPMFLWVSSVAATATGNLVKLILTTSPPPERPSASDMEKDESHNLDDEPYLDDPNAGLLGRSRSAVSRAMKSIPTTKSVRSVTSIATSLQVRILLILVAMWLLNFTYPLPNHHVPDGYTPHNFAKLQAG